MVNFYFGVSSLGSTTFLMFSKNRSLSFISLSSESTLFVSLTYFLLISTCLYSGFSHAPKKLFRAHVYNDKNKIIKMMENKKIFE